MQGQKAESDRINEGQRLESRRHGQGLGSGGKRDASETGSREGDTGVMSRRNKFLQSMQFCSSQEK